MVVGFFGTWLWVNDGWTEIAADAGATAPAEPWLYVDVHDSDVGTVRYAPRGVGSGEAFVGFTPRVYFEDEDASAPTDPELEAEGLADWAASFAPGRPVLDPAVVAPFLAGDDDEDGEVDVEEMDDFDDEADDDDGGDDADVFVEIKVARLLERLGLPLPAGLSTDEPGEG